MLAEQQEHLLREGNVSFYNQSENYAVFPTPVIGMLGLLDDCNNSVTSYFKMKEM